MPQVQLRWLPCTRDLRTYCQCSCKSAAFTATDIGAAEPTAGPKTAATSADAGVLGDLGEHAQLLVVDVGQVVRLAPGAVGGCERQAAVPAAALTCPLWINGRGKAKWSCLRRWPLMT